MCRRESAKPQLQQMGKLPVETIVPAHPGTLFATIGIDYAGHGKIKYWPYINLTFKKHIYVYLCQCQSKQSI